MDERFGQGKELMDHRIVKCTNNRLLQEQVQKLIRKEIDRMMACYGRTNQKTSEGFTFELFKANFSPNEVAMAVDEMIGNYTNFPTVADIKKFLNIKFEKNPGKKRQDERDKIQSTKDREAYLKLKQEFVDKLKWEKKEFDLWTRYYVREVFGESVLECSFLGCFEQIALKDLAHSNMKQDRAIERGRREINK